MVEKKEDTTREEQEGECSVCFSGGAEGADILFGQVAAKVGHRVVHYAFEGMNSPVAKDELEVIPKEELEQADEHIQVASELLQRYPPRKPYVKNLIRRNYFQVKDAERIYAITRWNLAPKDGNTNNVERETVEGQLGGGTGWAVAMGIALRVPSIYLYAIEKEQWYEYDYEESKWEKLEVGPPQPSGRYAGIGSRNLGEIGEEALLDLFGQHKL